MTLETMITIYAFSTGFFFALLILIVFDAIISNKPDKTESPQPKKTPPRGDNFIVCVCADCVHHVGYQCGIDRTYITSDGKCKSYVPRDCEIAKSGLKGATLSSTDH